MGVRYDITYWGFTEAGFSANRDKGKMNNSPSASDGLIMGVSHQLYFHQNTTAPITLKNSMLFNFHMVYIPYHGPPGNNVGPCSIPQTMGIVQVYIPNHRSLGIVQVHIPYHRSLGIVQVHIPYHRSLGIVQAHLPFHGTTGNSAGPPHYSRGISLPASSLSGHSSLHS